MPHIRAENRRNTDREIEVDTEGLEAHSSTGRKECECHQVRGDTKSQFDYPTIAHNRFALSKTDLHILMIQEDLVERIDSFVHGLLGDKEKPSMVWVIRYSLPLLRSGDQV
jgi:hypothetical protein